MIGVVLAAGEGRRLRPLTNDIPKTLVEVAPGLTVLDIALRNLASVGVTEIAVVVGYAASAIEERRDLLEQKHGVALQLVFNERASIWNNAYSLWLAREQLAKDALIVNGDTVHPASVEERVLAARGPDILIAVDDDKVMAEEEMKVQLDTGGALRRINKALDPAASQGEYIGVTLVEGRAAGALADALQATWERDPGLYYEDGFQEHVDRGGTIMAVPIGTKEWVEVDNHQDLERARAIACRY